MVSSGFLQAQFPQYPLPFEKDFTCLFPIQILFVPMVFLGFTCGVSSEAGHDSHQEFLLKLHVPTFSGVWIGKSARSASSTIRQTVPL